MLACCLLLSHRLISFCRAIALSVAEFIPPATLMTSRCCCSSPASCFISRSAIATLRCSICICKRHHTLLSCMSQAITHGSDSTFLVRTSASSCIEVMRPAADVSNGVMLNLFSRYNSSFSATLSFRSLSMVALHLFHITAGILSANEKRWRQICTVLFYGHHGGRHILVLPDLALLAHVALV